MSNGDNESVEMDVINNKSAQSPSSKDNSIKQKLTRVKHYSSRWKKNVTTTMKHRQNILSKGLIHSTDNIIRVYGYDPNILSRKSKHDKQNNIITINVSGSQYETHLSTLETYPNTLLGNKKRRKLYWNKEKNEYFFDRHRSCFQSILYYYQSNGCLRRPESIAVDTFIEEVLFFDLGPNAISQINKLENVSLIKHIDLPNSKWRRYVWYYFEYPQRSLVARILYCISMMLTVLSSISLATETLPEYANACDTGQNTTSSTDDELLCPTSLSSPFFLIQTICVTYFTLEFILRLIGAPSYWKFVLSLFNWIDLCAIIPYFVFLSLELLNEETDLTKSTIIGLRIFRLLRFLRVFKIYLIFKQFKSLRILSATLKESFVDFIIMTIILTLVGFLFGTATYYAEQSTNGDVFNSIPTATYWGIITITTIGYGDIYPISVLGRILACSCAFLGLAIGGIMVSVLVDRYQRVYRRKQYCPGQVLSAADSSDSEHDEKQEFIDRKLSGIKKSPTGGLFLPLTRPSKVPSSTNNRKNSKLSHLRFIISINEDKVANELMEEITKIIENSEEQTKLKLKTFDTDPSNDKLTMINELFSIS